MLVETEHNVVNVFNAKKLDEIHIEEIWISSNLWKKNPLITKEHEVGRTCWYCVFSFTILVSKLKYFQITINIFNWYHIFHFCLILLSHKVEYKMEFSKCRWMTI